MGRMLTFLSRILKDVDANPPALSRAVGIDEHTALLLDVHTGDIQAVGVGTAYVCSSDHKAQICQEKTPLTFQEISCTRLSGKDSDKYSFASVAGNGVQYTSNIVTGKFTNVPYGPV